MNTTYFEQYKYCPRCKGTFNKDNKKYFKCTDCSFIFYVNPASCNAAILENGEGKILMIERKVDPKKGYWDLPGGFVDINETGEESMIREIQEETGINLPISDLKYVALVPDIYYFQEEDMPTLCVVYKASILNNPEIKAADDAASYKFFSKDSLPYGKIAFPSLENVLKEYVSKS